jgi:hypothetical protein
MSTDPAVPYALWSSANGSVTVRYALPLFHDIDFEVNEGYRRIAHGGVEVGGVLYGRREGSTISIEAYRPIECEHASGPSFFLSARDLGGLSELLTQAKADPELKDLEPVGWFVAHTRSSLEMTAREAEIFAQYFPGPNKLTIIIKPERFQPTRFSFHLRDGNGAMLGDAVQSAVILPLPGRAGRASAVPVPSIPAPQEKVAVYIQPTEGPITTPTIPGEVVPPPSPPPLPAPPQEIRRRRSEQLRTEISEEPWRAKAPERRRAVPQAKPGNGRLALVLVLASLLGCAAGYWAYLQLPPARIVLHVQKLSSSLLVRWAPEQTRNAPFAAIRVDDQEPTPLTEEQRRSGQMEIKPQSRNPKIELIAQHWVRDSHGIVRYLGAPTPTAVPAAPPVNQEQH